MSAIVIVDGTRRASLPRYRLGFGEGRGYKEERACANRQEGGRKMFAWVQQWLGARDTTRRHRKGTVDETTLFGRPSSITFAPCFIGVGLLPAAPSRRSTAHSLHHMRACAGGRYLVGSKEILRNLSSGRLQQAHDLSSRDSTAENVNTSVWKRRPYGSEQAYETEFLP